MGDKWRNGRGHFRKRLPPCPECYGRMCKMHEDMAECEKCGFRVTFTPRFVATCVKCGRQVEVKQHADNPDKFDCRCECGDVTTLTRNKT